MKELKVENKVDLIFNSIDQLRSDHVVNREEICANTEEIFSIWSSDQGFNWLVNIN